MNIQSYVCNLIQSSRLLSYYSFYILLNAGTLKKVNEKCQKHLRKKKMRINEMKNSFEFSDVVFCFSSSFRLILILGFSLCVALFHSVGRSVERSVCVCVPFC